MFYYVEYFFIIFYFWQCVASCLKGDQLRTPLERTEKGTFTYNYLFLCQGLGF